MDPRTNLNILDLPNIFQSLADNRRTGTLKVKAGTQEKSVYFKDGAVQMVHTPLKSTILGEALIKTKSITEETLLRAIEQQRKTQKRLGETLIDMGAITEAQLVAALTFQISEEVCELFTWENLHCEFIPGEPLPGSLSLDAYTSQISLNAGALMMEAARRIDEWELIKRSLPSMQDVLVLQKKLSAKFKGTLRHELVKWVDGLRDVEEICDRARMSKFNALKTIRDLFEEKFLRAKTAAELVSAARAVQKKGGPRDQNLRKIIKLYERAEQLGVKNPKLSLWLAKAYERLNESMESATRYRSLGTRFLESGNLVEAAGSLKKIVEMNPDDLESHERLIDTYLKMEALDQAVGETLDLIDKYIAAGKAGHALAFANVVRAHVKEEPNLIEAIAQLNLEGGDNIQALIEYENAAEIMLAHEDYTRAIAVYEKMLDIDNENIDAHFKLAGALTKIGETNRAVKCYQTLADTLTSSGVLEDSINWQFLINVYENIVAIEPTNMLAREWLVGAYIPKDNREKVMENLAGLLEVLDGAGNHERKIPSLQKVIGYLPEDYQVRKHLSNAFRDAGQTEEAASEFAELALLATEKGDYDVGLEAYKEVLKIDPYDVETIAGIGKIYEIAGRYPEAGAQYKKAAVLYRHAERNSRAVKFFKKAAEVDRDLNGALLEAADVARQQGNAAEAQDLLQQFITLSVKSKNFGMAKHACTLLLSLKANDAWARRVLEQIDNLPATEVEL
jgi:tetratricopeptide (TPR) repeat protein